MDIDLIRVGAAMTNITPRNELPTYFGTTYHRGVADDDLLCHAVALSDGQTEVTLICCDLTFVDRTLLLRIRDACERKIGIPGKHVFVAATHDHAAPASGTSYLSGGAADPLYLDLFVDRVVGAVRAARDGMQPCAVVAGVADAPGYELNRRSIRPDGGIAFQKWPEGYPVEGPVDPHVGFLGFETQDGEPIALIVNYACHNNVCGGSSGTWHRDLFGRAADALREAFPSLRATPVLAAPCGNITCGDPVARRQIRGDDAARQVGGACARLVASAYREAARMPVGKLGFASRVLEIRDRPLSESTFCHDGCRGTDRAARAFARRRYDPEEKAVAERGETACPVEIAALALGKAAIVTNPAELFVEYGLQIQDRSPFDVTLVSELTNGACGYVPTKRAFEHGGYETHRSVYVSRLVPEAGEIIVRASSELLEALRQQESERGA